MSIERLSRSLHIVSFLVLCAGVFLLSGCDAIGGNDEEDLRDLAVIPEPATSEYDIAVASETEDQAVSAAFTEDEKVDYATYIDDEQRAATVFFGEDGLPRRLVDGEKVIVFENYGGGTFDAGVVTSEGDVKVVRDVNSPDRIEDLKSAAANSKGSKDLEPSEAAESASIAVDAGACAAAAVATKASFGLAVPAAVSACGSFFLNSAAAITGSESVDTAASGWSLTWCSAGDKVSCASEALSAMGDNLEESKSTIDEREEEIAEGTGVLRFAGVWSYPDREDDWFVVEKEKAFDAFLDEDNNCYDVAIGDFVSVDSNVFTYERREDGVQIELEYNRLSEEELRVRRLSDDLTLTMELNSEGDSDTYLNNRCGGSSTSASSKLIGR